MQENLIYDVGLHKGEDTDFYLRKGFQVIGIEANPDLVANAKIRFQDAIARGRLRVLEGAVAPASAGDTVGFYANPGQSVWGTIDGNLAARNTMLGSPSKRTEIKRVDIAETYRLFGIPFYLKIDIEGMDRLVIEQLRAFETRPQYVSFESTKVDFNQLKAEMDLLTSLGYTKFKVVQQSNIPGTKIRTRTLDEEQFEYVFEPDASGPFGDDLPSPWLTCDEALARYEVVFHRYRYFGDYSLVRKMPKRGEKIIQKIYKLSTGYRGPLPGWFDTHASL
jgi:FkbM family methyltransferase